MINFWHFINQESKNNLQQNVEIHKKFKETCENTLNAIKSRDEVLKENDSVLGEKSDIEGRIKKIQVHCLIVSQFLNYECTDFDFDLYLELKI